MGIGKAQHTAGHAPRGIEGPETGAAIRQRIALRSGTAKEALYVNACDLSIPDGQLPPSARAGQNLRR